VSDFEDAIRRHAPTLLDEVRGIAGGSGIDYETMYAFQLPDEIWAIGRQAVAPHCTSLGVNPRNGQPTIIGQNMDIPLCYHGYPTLLRIKSTGGVESLVLTFPGMIG